jgi:hypothetical protein
LKSLDLPVMTGIERSCTADPSELRQGSGDDTAARQIEYYRNHFIDMKPTIIPLLLFLKIPPASQTVVGSL